MTVGHMEILGSFGAKSPLLSLERTRDALASYVEVRWPVGRRKSVAREWELSADEARSVCEGSASQTTLDKIWLHPRGGWSVLFPVFGALLGQTADAFIQSQRKHHAELARRHRSLARDLRALAADRALPTAESVADGDRQRRAERG